MDAFNIKLGYGSKEVTLTILPTEDGIYKVIYYGGILGAIRKYDQEWDLVPDDDLIAGDLPPYQPELANDRIEIDLTEQLADRIGEEIDIHLEEE